MRTFERTHPWITFQADLNRCSHKLWMLLGEARSKCEHLAGVPLEPAAAIELWKVYLAKGAHATTSIEGNTLSETEVRQRMEGELSLPPSREYLGQEVDNVLAELRAIDTAIVNHEQLALDPARVHHFNKKVLESLPLDPEVRPGEIRSHSVAVGSYLGAPAEDCEYLLERLCEWLADDFHVDVDNTEMRFAVLTVKAVLAHLYIAWIHPFGDGNGRTARLVEFQILASCGLVPLPAANLLSDHYNRTREQYYRELDYASRSNGDIGRFLEYAVQGFVDGLRDQIAYVRVAQWSVAWENFVHRAFTGPETPTTRRRKRLVLDMPFEVVPRSKLTLVSPRVAQLYGKPGPRTLARDINALVSMGLLRRSRGGYIADRNRILAFLPPMAEPVEDESPR